MNEIANPVGVKLWRYSMKANNMTYKNAEIKPGYEHMHPWEVYAFDLMTEYEQCRDEGLDVEPYYDLFAAAMIVAASLLYGEGDFGKSICLAVQTGFDTDCNGATVGSVFGMMGGTEAIGACWKDPLQDTLHTSIFGVGTVRISECAAKTLAHVV